MSLDSMIAPEVLELLRCPVTGSRLLPASDELIDELNERIDDGGVVTRIQVAVSEHLDGGLVNDDKTLLVQVRNDVPTLIADELIELQTLNLHSTVSDVSTSSPDSNHDAEEQQGETGNDDF